MIRTRTAFRRSDPAEIHEYFLSLSHWMVEMLIEFFSINLMEILVELATKEENIKVQYTCVLVCIHVYCKYQWWAPLCSYSQGQPAVAMRTNVCICAFSFSFARVNLCTIVVVGPSVRPTQLVWGSQCVSVFIGQEMTLSARWNETLCECVWVLDRDGEFAACLKPSFVWVMYALCGGKLKNISMIKAG